jgi:prevent-host-death family protein
MASADNSIASLIEKKNTDILEEHPAINAREARINFAKIIQAARFKKNRVIITDHGEPAAGLVSIEDVRILDFIYRMALDKTGQPPITEMTVEDLKKFLGSDVEEDSSVPVAEGHKNRPN